MRRVHLEIVPSNTTKTEQLQIRVTKKEKSDIRAWAKAGGMDVSSWVLDQLLSGKRAEFRDLVGRLGELGESSFAFAALSDFLSGLPRAEFHRIVEVLPPNALSHLSARAKNYLAAMVEHAATQKKARPPRWTAEIEALSEPYFGTRIKGLRFLLLTESPVPFRRRNIFIDSSVGDRV